MAVDLGQHMDRAAGLLAALGKGETLDLTVLHVREVHPMARLAEAEAGVMTTPREEDVEDLDDAQRRLDAAVSALHSRGLEVGQAKVERAVAGEVSHRILEAASAVAADLIVIGAHLHRDLASALIGDTATRVVRGAKCSVLVVR